LLGEKQVPNLFFNLETINDSFLRVQLLYA